MDGPETSFDNLLETYKKSISEETKDIKMNTVFYSACGKWCYQISIIDYLQTFDAGKKREVLAKKLFKNADPKRLSATPPDPYGCRFIKFMKEVFEQDQKAVRASQEQNIEELRKDIEVYIKKEIALKIKDIFSSKGGKNNFVERFSKQASIN